MADENQAQPVVEAAEQTQAATSAETITTDTKSPELMIPKHRYDEVSNKLRTLEADAAKKAKDQQAEDEKKLAEQQQWQKLYEGGKARVDELTPKAELADKLAAMVIEQYEAEIKDWPEQVKAMAPDDSADVLAKLDWMKRAKPLATELLADKTPAAGNGRKPTPAATAGAAKAADERRKQWEQNATRRYR